MHPRTACAKLCLKLVGCPYQWGGKNPWAGFDCSGFAQWVLQVFGAAPTVEMDAQQLYYHFSRLPAIPPGEPDAGDLVFYGGGVQEVTHVMLALDRNLVVGASGGNHTTLTLEEARKRGAMVKVKPKAYRSDLVATVRVKFAGE